MACHALRLVGPDLETNALNRATAQYGAPAEGLAHRSVTLTAPESY